MVQDFPNHKIKRNLPSVVNSLSTLNIVPLDPEEFTTRNPSDLILMLPNVYQFTDLGLSDKHSSVMWLRLQIQDLDFLWLVF